MDELHYQIPPSVPIHDLDLDDGIEDLEADDTYGSNDPIIGTRTSKKPTSKVWEYFVKVNVIEVIKAKCKHCNVILSTGSASGTSHLLKHVK